MKTLVLGAGGMAGHVVALFLKESGFSVDTLSAHHKLDEKTHLIDIVDNSKFKAFLASNSYAVVINCIGLLVKPSEERKDLAVYLNSYLPLFLEHYYKDSKTKVIHLSSDNVVVDKSQPEQSRSFYDRTKALGEINNNKDLTFRMSIIGPDMFEDGPSLFNWFFAQKGEITGFTKVIWNGITTIELAKGIKAAIEQNLTGIYQLVPKTGISKYDLLQLFKKVFKKEDLQIKAADGTPANKTLHNTRKDFDYQVPDYPSMIKEMKAWVDNHPKLYKHYG